MPLLVDSEIVLLLLHIYLASINIALSYIVKLYRAKEVEIFESFQENSFLINQKNSILAKAKANKHMAQNMGGLLSVTN